MPDLGDAYRQYICVERGAAGANAWKLEGRQSRSARLVISSA
ncbi:MAG: hypothetical protein P8Y45_16355 [Exilibacterium sp.]